MKKIIVKLFRLASVVFYVLIMVFHVEANSLEQEKNERSSDSPNVGLIDFDPRYFVDAQDDRPFAHRLAGYDDVELDKFILGRSFFSVPWVVAPSATTARDGLGPLFNANTCVSCHVDNGAGDALADDGQPLRALTFKLAQPSRQDTREPTNLINYGDPVYGRQVAINGNGSVAPEAYTRLRHHERWFTFPDGKRQHLTYFEPWLAEIGYGPLGKNTRFALRQAPPLAGMNLVSQVSAKTLLTYADPDDANGDGISGRPNLVYDIAEGEWKIGKYGWKAGQPTLVQQTADAAANDMGLTNPLFPHELCSEEQKECLEAPRGRPSPLGLFDLPQPRLDAITFYVTSFKAPQPLRLSTQEQEGLGLFIGVGCTACHRQTLKTKDGVKFMPYSDFLLHDMGDDLADGRPEFDATVSEWRTAPLWGIGARVRHGQRFLHDARAGTLLEAVLWHEGEALNARDTFAGLPAKQRAAVIAFLEAL